MVQIRFGFLHGCDVYLATVRTDGYNTTVDQIETEDGHVPDGLDWDLIKCAEFIAVLLWMDHKATGALSGEYH